ncbi:tRNA-dihydrouridine synthase [Paramyrothecium foliicola]|nr:tRNA-dihydrouridine synthase [Paramyrothecium foliicola]
MAALVQTYPQQTGTVTMLQARPAPNSSMMAPVQSQPTHQFAGTSSQAPRLPYHNQPTPVYRGSTVPVQPYAFTSTPGLNSGVPWQQYGTYRTNSSPAVPMAQAFDPSLAHRSRSQPMNQGYVYQMGVGQGGSRDDSAIVQARNIIPAPRPHSAYLNQGAFTQSATTKAAPERYRRPSAQAAQHARSQSSTLPPTHGGGHSPSMSGSALAARPTSLYAAGSGRTMDDMSLYRQSSMEDVRRARQQSIHSNNSSDKSVTHEKPRIEDSSAAAKSRELDSKTLRVVPVHSRNPSSESVTSTRSSHSRPSSAANRNVSAPTGNPSLSTSDEIAGKLDQPRLINIPSRVSSTDAAKRVQNPSPLSKPVAMTNGSVDDGAATTTPAAATGSSNANLNSPAAQHLAAINQKGSKAKSKTSRLRRAFSFGSAAEFRKAGDEAEANEKAEPTRLHKDPTPEEVYDAEQARIAEAQEAAGIGNSIYGSRFFGSTDNLSISSTASSASIMIRKMGRGMKKSTRSLVGLFRPKSVIGVPAAEALAPEASQATVSMITVEAETRRVNVSADPQTSNGGTSFPHLERNSMDASQVPEMVQENGDSANGEGVAGRKSIVGGDKERAEVLAAVRKGILKRSSSPTKRAAEGSPELDLPGVPAIADSPNSSAPSTPNDDTQSHRRNGSIAIGNEDYFMSALRLRQDTKSAPSTPQGTIKRNATFSPRLVFHDTWPSQEYDRRGEIATCNRLTPMLAQQIKEELNTFKMALSFVSGALQTVTRLGLMRWDRLRQTWAPVSLYKQFCTKRPGAIRFATMTTPAVGAQEQGPTAAKLHGRAFYESIGSPKFVVAPMVDQSEFAWRLLSRSFLTDEEKSKMLAYTPMFHARLFAQEEKYRKAHFQAIRPGTSEPWLDGNPALDRPLFVQFCANDPQTLLAAAKEVAPYCDAVDLNLGCPQGIARKGRYGAFLQEDQDLIFRLINILHKELSIPVTAKIRILETKEKTLEYAQNVLRAGASILTVHGRRREQKGHLTGIADWKMIRFLRDSLPSETVIFANGNILQEGDLERCLQETGADGVMSAEGNLSDPGIFAKPPPIGEHEREFWVGKDGRSGWRVDAVTRRYLDILHKYAIGQEPPARRPLFMPGDDVAWMTEDESTEAEEPARKKMKREGDKKPENSPNFSATQPHLFHLLRHFVSKHTDVRDMLAKARRDGIDGYERVLAAVEKKVAEGLLEYERTDGKSFEDELDNLPKHNEELPEGESSAGTIRECKRPWWVAQPIIRPLPSEALAKGAISLKKKDKEKAPSGNGQTTTTAAADVTNPMSEATSRTLTPGPAETPAEVQPTQEAKSEDQEAVQKKEEIASRDDLVAG